MKFVHPEILWALGALAIPILVHLFNFRKFKKVLFSNVEFLKEIKQETQSKSKIKHWLILLSRLLAVTCIVFAFAQPYIPEPGSQAEVGTQAVSIFLDNSFSMEGENDKGRKFDLAKNKALEVANAFGRTDKFQLLTNDFEGRHQRWISKEEVIDRILETEISPSSKKLSEIISRQSDLVLSATEGKKIAFIVSDFQKTATDLGDVRQDSSYRVGLIPEQAPDLSNLYIDSIWFDSPVRILFQTEVLHAKVVNTGKEDRDNITMQLEINGQQKSVASGNVAANSEAVIDLSFTNTDSGIMQCELKIDDSSVRFDDSFFFSFAISPSIRIMEIQGANVQQVVAKIFGDDPYFELKTVNEGNVNFGEWKTQQLIILNQLRVLSSGLITELEKFVSTGGSVLVIPATESELSSYNQLLSMLNLGTLNGKMRGDNKVFSIDYNHYIYRNVFDKTNTNTDMPKVKAWYDVVLPQKSLASAILQLQGNAPFAIASSLGYGKSYLFTTSLQPEESNLTSHAFFPATLLRIAEYSQPTVELYYTIGGKENITLRNVSSTGDATFKLRNKKTGQEQIPEHRNAAGATEIYLPTDLKLAGNYEIVLADSVLSSVGLNYNRSESNTASYTVGELNDQINKLGLNNWSIIENDVESLAAGTGQLFQGKKYWLSMIIWALIFLAIEVLLIKYWR